MQNPSPSDPYREPAPEAESETPKVRLERLGRVLRHFGLWRFRWVRRLLGGQWEKYLLLQWKPDDEDDRQWIQEFWIDRDEHGRWPGPRSPPVSVGSWHRVTTWSTRVHEGVGLVSKVRIDRKDGTTVRISMSGRCLHVGTMRFIEFLGSRLALVAYYREDW